MKKEKMKERSIYILFKQTQRRCITIFSPGKEVREGAARGWEAVEAERGRRTLGAGGTHASYLPL